MENGVNNILDDVYEGMVVLDGFNDCILGRITQAQTEPKILYSIKCILSKLMEDGMSFDEAYDYFEFNIMGLNGKESFPAFLMDYEKGV
jgi:hypothetical protein